MVIHRIILSEDEDSSEPEQPIQPDEDSSDHSSDPVQLDKDSVDGEDEGICHPCHTVFRQESRYTQPEYVFDTIMRHMLLGIGWHIKLTDDDDDDDGLQMEDENADNEEAKSDMAGYEVFLDPQTMFFHDLIATLACCHLHAANAFSFFPDPLDKTPTTFRWPRNMVDPPKGFQGPENLDHEHPVPSDPKPIDGPVVRGPMSQHSNLKMARHEGYRR
ncbi:hypothetical protein VKT23_004471 [Stygiomarasmius scandens]|uniref:Uncharacterized protein n=1 Tax=Marasmiellus scandens TaxID=2682957 RepID=A0ABR1K0M3_9AGAR